MEESDKYEDVVVNINNNIKNFSDPISYYIYDSSEENAWIRSTVTIKQVDDDGEEKLYLLNWLETS